MRKILIICFLLFSIVAYTQPGSLDNSFGVFGISTQPVLTHYTDIAVQPGDGKIVVISANPNSAMFRYTSNGILDNSFGVNGKVDVSYLPKDLAITATGKIVVAGGNGSIYQYNADGSPDLGFGLAGVAAIDVSPIQVSFNAITIDAQNRVLAAGAAFFSGFETATFIIARVNANGTPDGSFNGGSSVFIDPFDNEYEREAEAISVRNDGKIIVLVDSRIPGNIGNEDFLISYNDNGSLNTGFSDDGRLNFQNDFKASAVDANAKILLVANPVNSLVRINSDGTVDNSFGNSGFVIPPIYGNAFSIQTDGRIIVAGSSFNSNSILSFALCRYNQDGTLDNSFGNAGTVITSLNLRSEIFDVAIHNKKVYAGGTLYVPAPSPYTVLGNPFGVLAAYDGSAVKLNCPGNQQHNTDPDQCYATVINIDPVLIPSDVPVTVNYKIEFNGNLIEQGVGSVSGKHFSKGVTTVTYSLAEGAGQACSFTVSVADGQAPALVCPQDITMNTSPGQCSSIIPQSQLGSATATDNCDGNRLVTLTGIPSGNIYPVGITNINYSATDEAGKTATCSQKITVVDNEPPTITGESASTYVLSPSNHTMRDVYLDYTINDNCSFTYDISVKSNEPVNGTGDGDTDPDWEIVNKYHVRLRAERSANGNGRIYTITITAVDLSGNTTTKPIDVSVPHNIKKPVSGKPFKVGSTVAFEGEFWDIPGNKHTAKWLINESTTAKATVTEPSGNKNGTITGSYKFSAAGVYKLRMNVTDQNGVTSYANTNADLDAIVVIYDPNGGNTYGGGYYNSPAGALKSNPTATGKASYGFAMNYFKNSTNPKGETQFEFKVGDFEFNALNFEYLVISNSMAQFKGTGKITGGQSGVGFTMTVIDGQLDGTGVDKIRMKIYNKNNGQVYYDNQLGASDAALPTQAVGANSTIVISGTNASITSANRNQQAEIETKTEEAINDLDVIAFPNPSRNNFTLSVKGNVNEKITMQVIDILGRVIEIRNVTANSIITFGDAYRAGTYFVRVMQGKEHKEIKLIKLTD